MVFEVDAARVSYEERDLTLIINTLNVNLRVDLSKACIGYNLIVFGVLVIMKLNVSDNTTKTDSLFS